MMEKCKNCNGTGFVQIAPNVRGIKKCPMCSGRRSSNENSNNDKSKQKMKLKVTYQVYDYDVSPMYKTNRICIMESEFSLAIPYFQSIMDTLCGDRITYEIISVEVHTGGEVVRNLHIPEKYFTSESEIIYDTGYINYKFGFKEEIIDKNEKFLIGIADTTTGQYIIPYAIVDTYPEAIEWKTQHEDSFTSVPFTIRSVKYVPNSKKGSVKND